MSTGFCLLHGALSFAAFCPQVQLNHVSHPFCGDCDMQTTMPMRACPVALLPKAHTAGGTIAVWGLYLLPVLHASVAKANAVVSMVSSKLINQPCAAIGSSLPVSSAFIAIPCTSNPFTRSAPVLPGRSEPARSTTLNSVCVKRPLAISTWYKVRMIDTWDRLDPAFILVAFTFRLLYTRSMNGAMSPTAVTRVNVCPKMSPSGVMVHMCRFLALRSHAPKL
mmetsp:Transcript_28898/g.47938  ORF Transcript_28898/g.47938 Transcript_28898/m.47938 type:complete len:222 (+) Transcript_28898:869-1534(+)